METDGVPPPPRKGSVIWLYRYPHVTSPQETIVARDIRPFTMYRDTITVIGRLRPRATWKYDASTSDKQNVLKRSPVMPATETGPTSRSVFTVHRGGRNRKWFPAGKRASRRKHSTEMMSCAKMNVRGSGKLFKTHLFLEELSVVSRCTHVMTMISATAV